MTSQSLDSGIHRRKSSTFLPANTSSAASSILKAIAPSQPPHGKIAIERAPPSAFLSYSSKAPGDKNRSPQACQSCRTKKKKCNGVKPKCQHCTIFELECRYTAGKRDTEKKQVQCLTKKVLQLC